MYDLQFRLALEEEEDPARPKRRSLSPVGPESFPFGDLEGPL